MPADPPDSLPHGDGTPPERSRKLLFALGALGLVSAVIAAVVIVSSGGQPKPAKDPEAQVRTSDVSLIVGRPDAPTKVVVFEDFGSSVSREFEIASRDFLEVEAAQGEVLVEYQPFPSAEGYSRQAVEAWAAVLQEGTAEEAMARAAEVDGLPTIVVDGRPLDRGTGIELADRLQRLILDD